MTFPEAIILDWELCGQAGLEANRFGLGEVIGLATSARDYLSSSPPKDRVWMTIVPAIDRVIHNLLDCWCDQERDIKEKIAHLGACLSLKGMLIQLTGTNCVVAGCDHLVAYELEARGLIWPHGSLVAAGAIATLPICDGVSNEMVERFADMVLATGILTRDFLQDLSRIRIRDVLRCAPQTRPSRRTLLHHLTANREDRAANTIRKVISSNE